MPTNSPSRNKKSSRVVSRSFTKKMPFSLRSPLFLVIVLAVAIFGGYLLYKSFALTNTVTYSGSFTKKKSSVSYSVNATANGTLTAVASYANTTGFRMELLASDGHTTTAILSGVNPQTMTVPVTKGTYALTLYGSPSSRGSGSYTVAISYPVVDTVPPVAAITSPATGNTIKGLTNIEGTATDNDGIAKVEVSVDGGTFTQTNLTGTSSTNQTWSYLLDTTRLSNAGHTLTVKATDLTGNTASASASYAVNNAVPVTDTTPPTVVISVPSSGSTVSDVTTFQGTASDNTSLAKIEFQVDGGSWSLASGTTAWSFNVDTTKLSNASHTVAVKATDGAGNVATASETVSVSNTTYSGTAPTTQGTWVSPEGVTINVTTTSANIQTGQLWTIADIYKIMKAQTTANATVSADFKTLGSTGYTVNVQDQYATMTTTSYGVSQTGVYSNYHATTWLRGAPGVFSQYPDYGAAHEYGIAWSQYWWALYHQADWSSYVNMRLDGSTYNGVTYQYLGQDPRYDTSQTWDPREIIADDYRLLFGSPQAISERPFGINTVIVAPGSQPGLSSWLLNTWR